MVSSLFIIYLIKIIPHNTTTCFGIFDQYEEVGTNYVVKIMNCPLLE